MCEAGRLDHHLPLALVEGVVPQINIEWVVRNREQGIVLSPQLQVQGRQNHPGHRAGQQKCSWELKCRSQERVAVHGVKLQIFVVVCPVADQDVVAVLPGLHHRLVHAARPAGVTEVHGDVHVAALTAIYPALRIVDPLRRRMIERDLALPRPGVIGHPLETGLILHPRDDVLQLPLGVPDPHHRRFAAAAFLLELLLPRRTPNLGALILQRQQGVKHVAPTPTAEASAAAAPTGSSPHPQARSRRTPAGFGAACTAGWGA